MSRTKTSTRAANGDSLVVHSLTGLVSALLPAEHGGPEPRSVARTAARLIPSMPPGTGPALTAAALVPQLVALATRGRTLARLGPDARAEALSRVAGAGVGGDQLVEAMKTLILLAHGAESHREEARARANRLPTARADGELDLTIGTAVPRRLTCDAVVIGSGAGGAFCARELARAGLDVVIVEEGRRWTVDEFRSLDPLDRFTGIYRDGGATFALGDPPIALPRGRAVGGTTLINSGTCFRTPDRVVERWSAGHGLALAEPVAHAARLDDVERTLAVAPAPLEVLGENGLMMLRGAERLGWDAAPISRNAPGCAGSCQCAIGCPRNAKAGVHLNALPEACDAGARIFSELTATSITTRAGRARGLRARDRAGGEVTIEAPIVVAAAGAIETPALLRRSRLGAHRQLGRNLAVHPALGVSGTFDEPVVAWRGVLQSAATEHLHEEHGVMIEATSTPPGMGSMIFPGVGRLLIEGMERAEHTGSIGAMIADGGNGVVHGSRRTLVTYRLGRRDRERLRVAIRAQAELLIAAGARTVELGGGAPTVRKSSELDSALERLDPSRLHLAAFHPGGTVRAGADPVRSPADPEGRLRGVRGVWVADASLMPTCPEVNPQLSIMALATGVGEAIAADTLST